MTTQPPNTGTRMGYQAYQTVKKLKPDWFVLHRESDRGCGFVADPPHPAAIPIKLEDGKRCAVGLYSWVLRIPNVATLMNLLSDTRYRVKVHLGSDFLICDNEPALW